MQHPHPSAGCQSEEKEQRSGPLVAEQIPEHVSQKRSFLSTRCRAGLAVRLAEQKNQIQFSPPAVSAAEKGRADLFAQRPAPSSPCSALQQTLQCPGGCHPDTPPFPVPGQGVHPHHLFLLIKEQFILLIKEQGVGLLVCQHGPIITVCHGARVSCCRWGLVRS